MVVYAKFLISAKVLIAGIVLTISKTHHLLTIEAQVTNNELMINPCCCKTMFSSNIGILCIGDRNWFPLVLIQSDQLVMYQATKNPSNTDFYELKPWKPKLPTPARLPFFWPDDLSAWFILTTRKPKQQQNPPKPKTSRSRLLKSRSRLLKPRIARNLPTGIITPLKDPCVTFAPVIPSHQE